MDKSYIIIQWPDIQYLMNDSDFTNHSYLINDNQGIKDYGSSAYFVEEEWAKDIIVRKRKSLTHDIVLDFIKHFQNEGTIKTFTSGCCYWFAIILEKRFKQTNESIDILYSPVYNHFITRIGVRFYDITGEVKDKTYLSWSSYQSQYPADAAKVKLDCILKR